MIIDANSYWFDEHIFHDETLCEQFLAEVPRAYDTEGYLTMNSAGKRQIVIEMPAGSPGLNYIEGDYTLEKRLADMDEATSSNMNKVQVFFIIVIVWFKIFHSIANISLLVGKYCSLGSFNIFFINLIRYFYRISFFFHIAVPLDFILLFLAMA